MMLSFSLSLIVLVQILGSGKGMSFFEFERYNNACVINKGCEGKIIGIKTEVSIARSTFTSIFFGIT